MAVRRGPGGTPRLLVVLGSGETAPRMTGLYRALLARLPAEPPGRVLETTYGFQENAGAITERIRSYFRGIGSEILPVGLPRIDTADPATMEQASAALRRTDWVFAGPGSPSYAIRQLVGTPLPDALRGKLRAGGALIFSSAAACTLGRLTAPVYEVYKVGAEPHWITGLDLLVEAGLEAVVMPHFDNTEGGTHDTRFCFLGERRMAILESLLPGGVWVLGVDEHTAALIDLDDDTMAVSGRGGVTVRTRAGGVTFSSGATVPLDRLREVGAEGSGTPATRSTAAPGASPAAVDELAQRFADALAGGDATAALTATLETERRVAGWPPEDPEGSGHARRLLRSMVADLATAAQAGLHEHRRLVAPFVKGLLDLRAAAREEGDFDLADRLRDHLSAGGVEVRDTPDGPVWSYREPRPPG